MQMHSVCDTTGDAAAENAGQNADDGARVQAKDAATIAESAEQQKAHQNQNSYKQNCHVQRLQSR